MTISVAVSGASGYAGGEVLRLLSNHPDVTIGAITAHSQCRAATGRTRPAPAFARRPGPGGNHRGESARTRRRLPGPAARCQRRDRRPASGRHPGHRRRGRPPPRIPGGLGEVLRLRARRNLALRPAGAARRPRPARRRQAHRRARLLPDLGPAGSGARLRRRPAGARRRRHGFRLRNLRRGQEREGQPHRLRGHGLHEPLRRGRRPPPHPGNGTGPLQGGRRSGDASPSPRPWRRCPAASSPPPPPRSSPAWTTATLRAAWDSGLRGRAVRARAARGPVARHHPRSWAPTMRRSSWPSTRTPAA